PRDGHRRRADGPSARGARPAHPLQRGEPDRASHQRVRAGVVTAEPVGSGPEGGEPDRDEPGAIDGSPGNLLGRLLAILFVPLVAAWELLKGAWRAVGAAARGVASAVSAAARGIASTVTAAARTVVRVAKAAIRAVDAPLRAAGRLVVAVVRRVI